MGPRFAFARRMRATSLGVTAVTVTILTALLPAAPAAADPTVAEIEGQIDQAWRSLEPTIEQYNQTRNDLAENKKKQAALENTLAPLELQVDLALSRVGDLAAHAYKSGSVSSLTVLLGNGSSSDLLGQLSILNQMSRKQIAEIKNVSDLRDQYTTEKRSLDELVSRLSGQEAELVSKKKEIETKISSLQKLRQQVYGSGGSGPLRPVACPVDYLGGAGGEAAKRACAQIGKPYSYGSSGPSSFDCSGLTMYSWSGKVSLPHSARDQYNRTKRVARADLRPGDLVFYYSPIHHVAIYVGGGWTVHAPSAGDHVRMAKVDEAAKAVAFGRPG